MTKNVDFSDDDYQILVNYMAERFVRRSQNYFDVTNPAAPISQRDVKQIALAAFSEYFPQIELTTDLTRAVFKRTMEETHNVHGQTVPIWNNKIVCLPSSAEPTVREKQQVAINTWRAPTYRSDETREGNTDLLVELLRRIMPQPVDRLMFIDWLAWNLQNEEKKPGWAVMLYSRRKGTGKSTLCRFVQLLFGEQNTITTNGISKLTSRFNQILATKKLIVAEEVQLKPETTQGNALKTIITERKMLVEGKGKEAVAAEQCCAMLITTNHFPHWIEAHERRYLVIEVDHDGHASGPEASAFAEYIEGLISEIGKPAALSAVYRGLIGKHLSNSFNPFSLNVQAIDTPIMRRLRESSSEIVLDQLEEFLNKQERYAWPQHELIKDFQELVRGFNPNRLIHMMNDLGWRREKVKFGGCDYQRVLWVHPDYSIDRGKVRGPNDYCQAIEPDVEIIEGAA